MKRTSFHYDDNDEFRTYDKFYISCLAALTQNQDEIMEVSQNTLRSNMGLLLEDYGDDKNYITFYATAKVHFQINEKISIRTESQPTSRVLCTQQQKPKIHFSESCWKYVCPIITTIFITRLSTHVK